MKSIVCAGIFAAVVAGCGGDESSDGRSSSGGGTSEEPSPEEPVLERGHIPCRDGCENEADLERPVPGPRPRCPTPEPTIGSDCLTDDEGLLCFYGEDPRVACRGRYECHEGTWRLPPGIFGLCHEPEEDFCPSEQPPSADVCTVSTAGPDMVCGYENNLSCMCYGHGLGNEPGGSGYWNCFGPPADGRCPAVIPNLGEGCEVQALQCRYEPASCDGASYDTVFCFNGEWELGEEVGCDL